MVIKYLRHLAIVAVVALASGIAFAMVLSRFNRPETPPEMPDTFKTPTHRRARVCHTTSEFEVSETYYRKIIDNNLFRPLGWRPPLPIEPYRLIGTILPRSENVLPKAIIPKAIIESTAGNTTHIVTTGEKLNASTEVVSIESKAVTLSTDGQQRKLKLPSSF